MAIHHQTFLIKPSSSKCNLNCAYCFYHKIAKERPENFGFMSQDLVDILLTKTFEEVIGSVNFIFQGGEPLLVGLEYYEYFVKKVETLNTKNIQVNYSLQTNGVNLDDRFADFFKDNNFLIGISLDGTKEIHNYYRDDSYDDVIKAIQTLKNHNVDFNILTVVTKNNVKKATDLYNFFKAQEFNFQQYIPYLEVSDHINHEFQPDPIEYGEFLVELFDLWHDDIYNNTPISISNFEDFIKNMLNLGGATCGLNGVCNLNLVVEANGNLYPCDFITSSKDCIGNIKDMSLNEIIQSSKVKDFLLAGRNHHINCQTCKYRFLCKGGCKAYKNDNNMYYYCHSFKHLFSNRPTKLNDLAKYFYERLFKHQ